MNSRGVSLVEVLVALLVVSCGALANVALELASRRTLAEAAQRRTAAQLAYELAERMREQDAAGVQMFLDGNDRLATPAAGELRDWRRALDSALVSPAACIAAAGDGSYDLTLAWRGSIRLPPSAAGCGQDIDAALRRTLHLRFTLLARG